MAAGLARATYCLISSGLLDRTTDALRSCVASAATVIGLLRRLLWGLWLPVPVLRLRRLHVSGGRLPWLGGWGATRTTAWKTSRTSRPWCSTWASPIWWAAGSTAWCASVSRVRRRAWAGRPASWRFSWRATRRIRRSAARWIWWWAPGWIRGRARRRIWRQPPWRALRRMNATSDARLVEPRESNPYALKYRLARRESARFWGQMQNTASLPADQFEALLHRLPAALDLDSLARETKAIERSVCWGPAPPCCACRWRAAPADCR